MDAAAHPPPKTKPRLRGVPHLVAAILVVPVVALLVQRAAEGRARSAVIVYGVSLFVLLATSAVYHKPMWTPTTRMRLRRVDRSAIFILIAGTYTPMCASIGGDAYSLLLPIVWGGAAVGVLIAVSWVQAPRWVTAGPYVLLGWAIVPYIGELYASIGLVSFALIGVGGGIYTVGALIYARRWPDPVPEVFGYHEVFHVLVVAAAGCHYAAVWRMVSSGGPVG